MSETCGWLHHSTYRLTRFRFPFDAYKILKDGIYVVFEDGETAHDVDRIVGIGTHTGEGQLPSRLQQHFLKENKDRSIFRKNVGRCLLSKEGDPFLDRWELDLTTREAKAKHQNLIDRDKLKTVESQVSEYIRQSFTFTVFSVADKRDRLRLESRMISSVSLCGECHPSSGWLGLFSPKEKIKQSGLWQVTELYKEPLSTSDKEELNCFYRRRL